MDPAFRVIFAILIPEYIPIILLVNVGLSVWSAIRSGLARRSLRFSLAAALNVCAEVEDEPKSTPLLALEETDVERTLLQRSSFSLTYLGRLVVLMGFTAQAIGSTILGYRRLAAIGPFYFFLDERNCVMALGGVLIGLWTLLVLAMAESYKTVQGFDVQAFVHSVDYRKKTFFRERICFFAAALVHAGNVQMFLQAPS